MNTEIKEKLKRIRYGEWEPIEFSGLYQSLSPHEKYIIVSTGHYFITSIKRKHCLICFAIGYKDPENNHHIGLVFETNANSKVFSKLCQPGRVMMLENNYPSSYIDNFLYFTDDSNIMIIDGRDEDEYKACEEYWIGSSETHYKDQRDYISDSDFNDENY